MNDQVKIDELLKKYSGTFHHVLGRDLNDEIVAVLDLSESNKDLKNIDPDDAPTFSEYIQMFLKSYNSRIAVGGYGEKRSVYSRSKLFDTNTIPRRYHLGIDLWTKSKTPVFCPLDGTIHSYGNNNAQGDYGPTIIIRHVLEDFEFYTLYGHLSEDSLYKLQNNLSIKKGQMIGKIGNFPINGNWPPHLHFQIISDMMGKEGDFWGVASAEELEKMLNLCPDPNIILNLDVLK